jgi:mRNA interferase MazF
MVKPVSYVPERGDIVWLEFDPQSGREHKGKRPALTVTPSEYNSKTGLAIFCPITSKVKGYPFEVRLKTNKIKGVVLSDQVKSLDWRARNAEFIVKSAPEALDEVRENLKLLMMLE